MVAAAASAQYTCDPTVETVLEKGKVATVGYIALDDEALGKLTAQGATATLWGPNSDDMSGNQNLYVWDGTMTGGDSSYPGVGDQVSGYASFVVANVGWSGAGYNIAKDTEGINTTWWNDETHFHLAYMTSGTAPASIALIMGDKDGSNTPAKICLGDVFVDNGVAFTAVGPKAADDWNGIDITFGTLKKLFPAFQYQAVSNWTGNLLSFLAGGVSGTTFAFDAVYFYQVATDGVADVMNDAAEWVITDNTINVMGANGIQLFDLSGKLVKATAGTTLGISNVNAGLYIAKAGNSVRKVVVK